MAFGNKPANTSNQEYDLIVNMGLRCFEQKATDNAIRLRCSKSRKKGDNYTAPVYFDVVITKDAFEKGNVACFDPDADYVKTTINVDGKFVVDEYTNKEGTAVPTMTIFPTRVEKLQR